VGVRDSRRAPRERCSPCRVVCALQVPPFGHDVADASRDLRGSGSFPANSHDGSQAMRPANLVVEGEELAHARKEES
jgi:hypothetical protein